MAMFSEEVIRSWLDTSLLPPPASSVPLPRVLYRSTPRRNTVTGRRCCRNLITPVMAAASPYTDAYSAPPATPPSTDNFSCGSVPEGASALLSVIVPTYNASLFIDAALRSLNQQSILRIPAVLLGRLLLWSQTISPLSLLKPAEEASAGRENGRTTLTGPDESALKKVVARLSCEALQSASNASRPLSQHSKWRKEPRQAGSLLSSCSSTNSQCGTDHIQPAGHNTHLEAAPDDPSTHIWAEQANSCPLAAPFELIVFDDHSTDDTLSKVCRSIPTLEASGWTVVVAGGSAATSSTIPAGFAGRYSSWQHSAWPVAPADEGGRPYPTAPGSSLKSGSDLNTSPRGPGYARNCAVRLSSGTFLAFCDADDVSHPDRLLLQFCAQLQLNKLQTVQMPRCGLSAACDDVAASREGPGGTVPFQGIAGTLPDARVDEQGRWCAQQAITPVKPASLACERLDWHVSGNRWLHVNSAGAEIAPSGQLNSRGLSGCVHRYPEGFPETCETNRGSVITQDEPTAKCRPHRLENTKTIIGTQLVREPPGSTPRLVEWLNSLSGKQLLTSRFRESTVGMPTWWMPRSVFDQVGGFMEGVGVPEDLLFLYRHTRRTRCTATALQKTGGRSNVEPRNQQVPEVVDAGQWAVNSMQNPEDPATSQQRPSASYASEGGADEVATGADGQCQGGFAAQRPHAERETEGGFEESRCTEDNRDPVVQAQSLMSLLETADMTKLLHALAPNCSIVAFTLFAVLARAFSPQGSTPFSDISECSPLCLLELSPSLELARVNRPLVVYRFHDGCLSLCAVHRNTLWTVRIEELVNAFLATWPRFGIWNAGKAGRKFYRSLPDYLKRRVTCFYDVDWKKIRTVRFVIDDLRSQNTGDAKDWKRAHKRKIPILHWTWVFARVLGYPVHTVKEMMAQQAADESSVARGGAATHSSYRSTVEDGGRTWALGSGPADATQAPDCASDKTDELFESIVDYSGENSSTPSAESGVKEKVVTCVKYHLDGGRHRFEKYLKSTGMAEGVDFVHFC